MKILSCSICVIFSFCVSAQSVETISPFSTFQLGVLGGINFSSLVGASIVIEGSTNLTSNTNIKLSLGYSTVNKEEGYKVNTYRYEEYFDIYRAESYAVDEINYTVVPISLGLEYIFSRNKYSPYALLEIGYNFYTFKITKSNIVSYGTYDSYEELPSEYKNEPPDIPEDESYTIALGLGTNYKISNKFNLDIRYLYQFNISLVNTSQILIGFNF
jgi:opacity protein-like surface antigen